MFFPSPPNDIFPMAMATNAPIIRMIVGKLLGTLKASKTPVIIAEPSEMVAGPLIRYFCMRYSNSRLATTEIKITRTAPIPKK